MRLVALLSIALICTADITAPIIGYMRDRAGALRPLRGVAGAFVVGDAIEREVLSSAWSGVAGLAKTRDELLILKPEGIVGREPAPPGPAAFGFADDGALGWARFADGSCRRFASNCPSYPENRPVLRCRLPDRVQAFEQLGDGWLLARTDEALYAIRSLKESDELFELPESPDQSAPVAAPQAVGATAAGRGPAPHGTTSEGER